MLPGFFVSLWLLLINTTSASRSLQHVGKLDVSRRVRSMGAPPVQRDDGARISRIETRALDVTAPPLFLTDKTRRFAVNGSGLPDIHFDLGESYSGSLPITSNQQDPNKLFFWFFPSQNPMANKEIMIWLNGGPGCSSLAGLFQENGPLSWQPGTFRPVRNPWGWTELTNVIWVEQPIGTGFSEGTPTAQNEDDVARQFMGFWRNFVDTFNTHGYRVYIAGESYAGAYCPYIADAMLNANDTDYFNVTGMMIYDPVIGSDSIQEPIVTMGLVDAWPGLFPFNTSFMADLRARDARCGLTDFMNKGLSYPPKGPLPVDTPDLMDNACASIFEDVWAAALNINPCFNIYNIEQGCPMLWDVLGFPGSFDYIPEGTTVYFNRTDVRRAIHAPATGEWKLCKDGVFVNGVDKSPPSSRRVLPNVIDRTKNVIIGHGSLDMVLIANGTLLAIQNMTWGGQLGFQERPSAPFFVPRHDTNYASAKGISMLAASGVMGVTHTERGLTYVGVELAGHMIPQYAPSAAFRHLEVLLGRVANLSSTEAFTTMKNFSQPAASELGGPPSTAGVPARTMNGTKKSGAAGGAGGQSAAASTSYLSLAMLVAFFLLFCPV